MMMHCHPFFYLIILLLIFSCKSPEGENLNNKDETSDINVTTHSESTEIVIIKDSTEEVIELNIIEDSSTDETAVEDSTTDESSPENIEEVKEESNIDRRLQFELDDNMDLAQLRVYMEGLFNTIEDKIAEGDFQGWYSSLSKRYKTQISDKEYLEAISRRAKELSEKNIILKSAEDYFVHVVVPSRAGRSLKYYSYKYIDKFHVNVISTLDGSGKFKYNFIYEDNSWKLDL